MLLLLSLPIALAATPDDARTAFNDWMTRGAAFDPSVADLYSPEARITLLRDGANAKALSGSQMQALIRQTMDRAKATNDRSTFDQITVHAEGNGFRVQAHRTSARKCYTDTSFQQLWMEVEGALRIVEEQLGSVTLSRCPPSEALTAGMAAVVDGITPHLPMKLDEQTVLDAVRADGRALRYDMKLPKIASTDADPAALYTEIARSAMRGGCSDPTLRKLMSEGATVVYTYRFSDDQPLGELPLTASTCAMLR